MSRLQSSESNKFFKVFLQQEYLYCREIIDVALEIIFLDCKSLHIATYCKIMVCTEKVEPLNLRSFLKFKRSFIQMSHLFYFAKYF